MRLDKFLAESGIGTRRNVRNYIKDEMVKVNGEIISEPAIDIKENTDVIEYLDKEVKYKGKVYYMFNKPKGCITARTDKIHKTVFDYFYKENMNGIFHVGRLDKDTEGLLLFTNDGEFEHNLMSPDNHVEKKYYFSALGSLDENDIKKLENGVLIINSKVLTKPAKVEILKNEVYENDSENYKQKVVSGYITISEGRKHQVKRMLKAVGCFVVYLKRISIGNLLLDETLKEGEYRFLTEDEIKMLS
ncbi:pseudouridine synthase [Clostridium sp. BJN0001]|uniref:pseudouridine synthase n=1 Tax=Clostridium sp. BJN0001 TaxID=2930219 RepID=UPI001FD1EEEC|nr:pseudouridine synthase [Clostridium sp. BJN0001]